MRLHGGLVLPHHNTMMYFIEDYARGVEITYGRALFDPKSWESYFNYPEIGLGLYYGTFGNSAIYGEGFAVYPYIHHPIYRRSRIKVESKLALGLAYATRTFDIDNNLHNTLFSSHLNAYISMGLHFDYRIHKRFSLSAGATLTHLSNGAVKKPNHGVNTLTANLGGRYHFNETLTPTMNSCKAHQSTEREILIVGSAGRCQSTLYNAKEYWNGSLSINHLWHLNKKRALGIGFDQFYAPSAPLNWSNTDELDPEKTFSKHAYYFNGLFASYNVFLNKTCLFVNVGVYLHTKVKPPQPVYPRLGIRRYITPNIIANFSVKSSFFRSEFLEFGLGYSFNYRKNNKS